MSMVVAGPIRSYRDLVVWQRAVQLTAIVYKVSRRLPKDELYGLISQMRRAATSVPANIAEGYGRESRPAYVNHLRIAQGSLKELETHLLVAEKVGLIHSEDIAPALAESDDVGRLLRSLIRSLIQDD